MHSGERPFKCDLCFKSFVVSSSLRKHERTHLAERPALLPQQAVPETVAAVFLAHTSLPQFSCSHCDVTFGTWEEVQAHEALHTVSPLSTTVAPLPMGPHVCATCREEFVLLSDLQAHEKMHPKPRPHVCDSCGKGFLNKAGLRKHQRIHSTNRNHVCPHCSKAFLFAAYLRKHLRTHRDPLPTFPLSDTHIAHTEPLPSPPPPIEVSSSTLEPGAICLTIPVTIPVTVPVTFQTTPMYIDKEDRL